MKKFKSRLRRGPPEFVARAQFLERQHQFVDKLVQLVKAVAKESGTRTVRPIKLNYLNFQSKDGPTKLVIIFMEQ